MGTEKESQTQTAIRLPDSLLEELDGLADTLSQPGMRLTRTDALRLAIYRGVEQLKKEKKR